ncbi:MAG: Dabb family protein [Verrucomicrobiota bacterium]
MKKALLTLLAAAAMLTLGTATATAGETAPKSVIHVVSVKWKAEATPEQIKAALDGVQALPKAYPGITRVWTNVIKKQGDWSHVFVMEFKDAQALKDYADSAAQKEWYKAYLPIRERSNSHDITN